MQVKLWFSSILLLSLVSTSLFGDVITIQGNAAVTTMMPPANNATYWENIIDRNEDNANGVLLNQHNHVSAYAATQASHMSKRGTDNNNPYEDVPPNNKGKTSLELAEAELYFDSQVTNWARVHVATQYAQDFTNPSLYQYAQNAMFFPEAYAELNNFQQGDADWAFAKIGRQYVNFTSRQSALISQPLTTWLGLTNVTAMTVGVANLGGFYSDAYVYNGNLYGTTVNERANSANTIHSWGAEMGYAMNVSNNTQLNVFADYIANLTDSLNFGYNTGDFGTQGIYPDKKLPGYALHVNYMMGPLAILADYVSMLSAFSPETESYDGKGAKLSAYGFEADYLVDANHSQTISLGYQGSAQALQFNALQTVFTMPRSRILAGYQYAISSNVALKFEYMFDKDYNKSDSVATLNQIVYGSSASNNTILARLNVTF